MAASPLQRLPDVDRRTILWLANRLAGGAAATSPSELAEQLQVDSEQAREVLVRMVQLGAIDDCSHSSGLVRITDLRITPQVFELQQAIETPPDRVAEFLTMLRSHEATYRWVIVATGVAFTLGAVNELFELIGHVASFLGR
jgi:hypothetical protein